MLSLTQIYHLLPPLSQGGLDSHIHLASVLFLRFLTSSKMMFLRRDSGLTTGLLEMAPMSDSEDSPCGTCVSNLSIEMSENQELLSSFNP